MDFKERLIYEKIQLSERLHKLEDFIFYSDKFKDLSLEQRKLLSAQAHVMTIYYMILEERLKLV